MIPREQIEKVKESIDIVDIIGSYVKLNRRGRNFIALCPFHSEKTPSFTVSPDKQMFYCFGCNRGGDAVKFLMEHEKMGYVDAVKHLAGKAGIALQETSSSDGKTSELRDDIFNANRVAQEYFLSSLREEADNIGVRYLKKRKISAPAVEEFELGFAPDRSNGLIRFASGKGVKSDILYSAGLLAKTSSGHRDFFRGRLIFPVMNLSGKVVAFGGRALKDGETAKYINTPETPVYKKGDQLFGLHLTKDFIRNKSQAIVVEGYTDLISLYASGIKNVVCSSGTAFTPAQASLISRFADRVVLLFDSDEAGIKAANRSVGILFSRGVDVSICILPDSEDPDSYVKSKGAKQLRDLIETAMPYAAFKRYAIGKNFSELSVSRQEELVDELNEVISLIDDPLKKKLVTEQLERTFDFPISAYAGKPRRSARVKEEGTVVLRNRTTLERELLTLLAENQQQIPRAAESLSPDCFTDSGCRAVYVRMIDEYTKFNSVDIKKWVGADTRPEVIETLAGMDSVGNPWASSYEVIEDYIERFRIYHDKMILRRIKEEILTAEKAGDSSKAIELQKRYMRVLTGAANK